MSLPAELDLGGVSAVWVWADGHPAGNAIPAGVLLDHGGHTLLVPWARRDEDAARPFTLEALVPLTLTEIVVCGICGATGKISGGAWHPVGEVARG